MALGALHYLSHAVAVIDAGGHILFENSTFSELFAGESWAGKLLDPMSSVADGVYRAAPREIRHRDGRIFDVKMVRVPQGLLVTAEDISGRVAEKARAAELTRTDPITSLGNRLMFRERLTALLANPDHVASAAAVLIFDLDRFKAINDSLGASVGDALLRVVAERARSAVGPSDLVTRFGGDEFGIVQIGQPQPESGAALAKRLVDLLGRSYIVDGHLLNVGASVGIALIPADGRDTDQILKNADLALNRAKQGGQGNFRFFETAMDEQIQAHRSLELDFRRALALRELALVYQPQLNLASKRITGFEALLRWHNPKRGLVSPADFIPLAEQIGLIVPIGEWVIRTACIEAARWPRPLSVAVNVSAVQFGSPNLVSTVLSALAESGLDPRRLELEITESVLLGDHRAALDVLLKVRELGVRVSMDDFGTGYSSLSYLRSFPFDKIKIDQSFVRGRSDDTSGMAIVRAIAGLGRSLGMTTLAEGVETDEQLARVEADGCTDVQGYLISRPLPPERIGEFLQSRTEGAAPATAENGSSIMQNTKA
ncbi:MAG: diguanylate cyclase/phosphodiesterase [Bradyrhizobium sp.]|nr:diguanylate cyclase/phosphodiesterase [Bradyrhizobium sp.]